MTIDQVINDERKEPLSREDYDIFLQSRCEYFLHTPLVGRSLPPNSRSHTPLPPLLFCHHNRLIYSRRTRAVCAENLGFLIAVNDWTNNKFEIPDADAVVVVEMKQQPESEKAEASPPTPAALREAKWICQKFVAENSPDQVNISAVCRKELLVRVDAIRDEFRDPAVFADAYKEIRNLLLRDAWEPWVAEQTSRNLNKQEVVNR